MAFETGTDTIVCPVCAAKHTAEWSRMPVRENMKVCCKACGAVAFNAKTLRDYYDVRLTEGPPTDLP